MTAPEKRMGGKSSGMNVNASRCQNPIFPRLKQYSVTLSQSAEFKRKNVKCKIKKSHERARTQHINSLSPLTLSRKQIKTTHA